MDGWGGGDLVTSQSQPVMQKTFGGGSVRESQSSVVYDARSAELGRLR